MAEREGVVFTQALADKVAEATESWLRQRGNLRTYPPRVAAAPQVVTARVTGAADGSGNYPAVVTVRDPDAGTWTDYDPVRVRDLNGGTLASGTRYGVVPAGEASGGYPLFDVVGEVGAATVPVWLVTNVCPVFDDEDGTAPGRYIHTGDAAGGGLAGSYPNPTIPRIDGGTF